MKRRTLIGSAGTVATALFAGCLGGGGDGGDGGTDTSETEVTIEDEAFDPVRVSIDPGTTVKWVNEASSAHAVLAAQFHEEATEWSYDEIVRGDKSVTHTFEESGIYEYKDRFSSEQQMCGVVLVGDVSLDASLPCE